MEGAWGISLFMISIALIFVLVGFVVVLELNTNNLKFRFTTDGTETKFV